MKAIRLSELKLPWPVWAAIALIPLATGATAAVHALRVSADATYVARDTFDLYRTQQTFQHRTDSLVAESRTARIDSALAALVRACQHRGECP